MRGRKGAIAGILFAGIGAVTWQPPVNAVTLRPTSQLWVDGKSTIRDWTCKATSIQSVLDAQGEDPVRLVLSGERAIRSVELSVPIDKMDCGNGTMKEHMMKALKAPANPNITFRLESYDLKESDSGQKATLNGSLKIGGVAKPIVLIADIVEASDGALRVTGTYDLVMTEYGVKPPSLMLGTMKVKDRVTVGFDLLLDR